MALARSLSGPSGLSINTNSANSLFGNTTTASPGGMFGNTAASKPLFGGATTAPAPQGGLFGASTGGAASGGLFGAASTSTSQPQTQTGGMFGATGTAAQPQAGALFGSTPATQPQTGGLFGATAASQPATGGLFGASTAATQPQTGGLFGQSTATTQPQPQQTGGLFGAAQPQTQATGGLFGGLGTAQNQTQNSGMFGASQPAQGGGLFGGLNNQNQNKPTGSLFGNNPNQNQQQQQQQQQQQGGMNQNQNQQSGFLGGLTMGAANQQNQQPVIPGVRINMDNIRSTTRFEDLYEEIQKEIQQIDDDMQTKLQLKHKYTSFMSGHADQLARIPNDVEFCRRKLLGVESALATDVESIAHVQRLVNTDAAHAKLSRDALDRLKLPAQYHNNGVWHSKSTNNANQSTDDSGSEAIAIVDFFSATADELSSTLTKYKNNFKEIELHLRSVEANVTEQVNSLVAKRKGNAGGDNNAIQELAGALTEFEHGILHVAGKVGGVREGVQQVKIGSFTGRASRSTNGGGHRGGVY